MNALCRVGSFPAARFRVPPAISMSPPAPPVAGVPPESFVAPL